MTKSKAEQRLDDLVALKDKHDLTYEQLAEITGYSANHLRCMGSGLKPVTERALKLIAMAVEEHAKSLA